MFAPLDRAELSHRPTSFGDRLGALLDQPALLVLILGLLRAVVYPYLGIIHDAQLYGLQAVRRVEPERFANDLFFQFGSQDQYSLFSWMVAPLVAFMQLPIAFFLIYTLFSMILIAGQVRIVTHLIQDRFWAIVALVMLVVGDLSYGGHGIFQVHEPFLTARLPATALATWGLAFVLTNAPKRGIVCLMAGLALHPIMVLPAVALCFWWMVDRYRRNVQVLVYFSAAGLLVGLLAVGLTTGRLHWMSAEWVETVRKISPQCFPLDWEMSDWIQLGFAVAALVLASHQGSWLDRRMARGCLVIGLSGLGLTLLSQAFPIDLLAQTQPYRALWLVEFFAIPLGVSQALRLWREPTRLSRLLAILLMFGLGRWRTPDGWDATLFWPYAGAVTLLVIVVREVFGTKDSRRPDRATATAAGLFLTSLLVGLVSMFACIAAWEQIRQIADPLSTLTIAIRSSGNAVALFISALIIAGVARMPSFVRGPAVFVALVIVWGLTLWVRREVSHPSHHQDIAFVQAEIEHLPRTDRTNPTVYWPTDIRDVWFHLGTCSYYHFLQIQGVVFRDVTALEASRRLDLVRPFEFRRLHYLGPLANRDRLEPWLGHEGQGRPVRAEDLERLAQDPALDVVVLPYGVGSLPARSNGRVWIYDCRQIRAATSSWVENGSLQAPISSTTVRADFPTRPERMDGER